MSCTRYLFYFKACTTFAASRLPDALHAQALTERFSSWLFFPQTKIQLFEILRSLEAVPGVPIETGAEVKTPATLRMPEEDEDMPDADRRQTGTQNSERADFLVGGTVRYVMLVAETNLLLVRMGLS